MGLSYWDPVKPCTISLCALISVCFTSSCSPSAKHGPADYAFILDFYYLHYLKFVCLFQLTWTVCLARFFITSQVLKGILLSIFRKKKAKKKHRRPSRISFFSIYIPVIGIFVTTKTVKNIFPWPYFFSQWFLCLPPAIGTDEFCHLWWATSLNDFRIPPIHFVHWIFWNCPSDCCTDQCCYSKSVKRYEEPFI